MRSRSAATNTERYVGLMAIMTVKQPKTFRYPLNGTDVTWTLMRLDGYRIRCCAEDGTEALFDANAVAILVRLQSLKDRLAGVRQGCRLTI